MPCILKIAFNSLVSQPVMVHNLAVRGCSCMPGHTEDWATPCRSVQLNHTQHMPQNITAHVVNDPLLDSKGKALAPDGQRGGLPSRRARRHQTRGPQAARGAGSAGAGAARAGAGPGEAPGRAQSPSGGTSPTARCSTCAPVHNLWELRQSRIRVGLMAAAGGGQVAAAYVSQSPLSDSLVGV